MLSWEMERTLGDKPLETCVIFLVVETFGNSFKLGGEGWPNRAIGESTMVNPSLLHCARV